MVVDFLTSSATIVAMTSQFKIRQNENIYESFVTFLEMDTVYPVVKIAVIISRQEIIANIHKYKS